MPIFELLVRFNGEIGRQCLNLFFLCNILCDIVNAHPVGNKMAAHDVNNVYWCALNLFVQTTCFCSSPMIIIRSSRHICIFISPPYEIYNTSVSKTLGDVEQNPIYLVQLTLFVFISQFLVPVELDLISPGNVLFTTQCSCIVAPDSDSISADFIALHIFELFRIATFNNNVFFDLSSLT